MGYVVELENYHGPLNLLLYLIEKNEFDIFDIPVAVIAEQYIDYIYSTGSFDLEDLGDFLIMASYLLNLKSRMLFPQLTCDEKDSGSDQDNNLDPREELIQKLLDYRKYRKAAAHLEAMQKGDFKRVFYRGQDYGFQPEEQIIGSVGSLARAYKSLMQDRLGNNRQYELPQSDIDISEKMDEIMKYLQERQGEILFQDLFARALNIREALAFFLALLELVRLQKVVIAQEKLFSDIKISLRQGT